MRQPLPCPFCGDIPTLRKVKDGGWVISHGSRPCLMIVGGGQMLYNRHRWWLINAWNTRA